MDSADTGGRMRELKKYQLRASKKPKNHALLSGVVHVYGDAGIGYTYLTFSEAFVDAVGKCMQYGLRADAPGYLKVMFMPGVKVWRVFAMYFKEERGVLLWESPEKPAWLGTLKN